MSAHATQRGETTMNRRSVMAAAALGAVLGMVGMACPAHALLPAVLVGSGGEYSKSTMRGRVPEIASLSVDSVNNRRFTGAIALPGETAPVTFNIDGTISA